MSQKLLASSASSNQKEEEEEEEQRKEDISCQGRFLDEYMKNAEVDPTLIVSKPDRTLMVSRGKIPAFSTNIYRKSSNDEEAPASLIVAAGSMSSQSQRGVSVASDYSMLSFGSVLSDEEDQPPEEDVNEKNKKSNVLRNPMTTSKTIGIRCLPSSGLVSNEWRKKLAISPAGTNLSVISASRLENQLKEFLEKEIRKLRKLKMKYSATTPEVAAVPPPPATTAPTVSGSESKSTIEEKAEKESKFHEEEQRLDIYDAAMDLFIRSPEMRAYKSFLVRSFNFSSSLFCLLSSVFSLLSSLFPLLSSLFFLLFSLSNTNYVIFFQRLIFSFHS